MGTEVKISNPVVSYCETCTSTSNQTCLSKSPNKHNRLYCEATQLEDGICNDIEDGKINQRDDPKLRARYMADTYGWDVTDARKIRSEEHTSELQSLMRISYAVFCLKKKKKHTKLSTIIRKQ